EWKPRITIPSEDIVDLSEVPSEPALPPPTRSVPANPPAPTVPIAQKQPPPPSQPVFVDPAIVAVGKPAVGAVSSSSRVSEPYPPPNTSEKCDPGSTVVPPVQIPSTSPEGTPTNTVAASLRDLKLGAPTAVAASADEDGAEEKALDYGEV